MTSASVEVTGHRTLVSRTSCFSRGVGTAPGQSGMRKYTNVHTQRGNHPTIQCGCARNKDVCCSNAPRTQPLSMSCCRDLPGSLYIIDTMGLSPPSLGTAVDSSIQKLLRLVHHSRRYSRPPHSSWSSSRRQNTSEAAGLRRVSPAKNISHSRE